MFRKVINSILGFFFSLFVFIGVTKQNNQIKYQSLNREQQNSNDTERFDFVKIKICLISRSRSITIIIFGFMSMSFRKLKVCQNNIGLYLRFLFCIC